MVKWASWLPGIKAQAAAQPEQLYVLVPPMFERDIRDRDRFAYSSYFYAFGKRQLKWLFEDYLHNSSPYDSKVLVPKGVVLFSPPTDQRLTVAASVAREEALMNVRYQPLGPGNPATFLDVNVSPQSPDKTSVRCSLFDPTLGFGAFAIAPLAKQLSNTYAQAGVRYSSPNLSTGVVVEPARSRAAALWLVARQQGLVAGIHLEPDASGLPTSLQAFRQQAQIAVAYEPSFRSASGVGQFSASLEMQNNRQLLVSFLQHMAVVRKVVNPLEDQKTVAGITNYVDLGIQIAIPTVEEPSSGSTSKVTTAQPSATGVSLVDSSMMRVAAAWQVNKNWLLKARISDADACVGVAFKTWGRLGVVAATNLYYRYGDPAGVRYGAHIQLENFGEKRYERGVSEVSGQAVLQRHVASETDINNLRGSGKVVRLEAPEQEYNTPVVDQTAGLL